MAKSTIKLNEMKRKDLKKFKLMFLNDGQLVETFIEGEEISNVDGLIEVWSGSELTAVINDYVLIAQVSIENPPE